MCVVSNVGDYWGKDFGERYPWYPNYPQYPSQPIVPYPDTNPIPMPDKYIIDPKTGPTQEEFDALKREVEALKKLLEAAKAFDIATNQPDCEMDAKVKLIKDVAKYVGVDLKDIFP